MPSLEFKNLPLQEVALRFAPATQLPIGLTWFGALHDLLEDDFSSIIEPIGIEGGPFVGNLPMASPSGTKALALADQSTGTIALFQSNLLVVRWIRWGTEPYSYARYSQLRTKAVAVLQAVAKLIGEQPDIGSLNMSYTNLIPAPDEGTAPYVRAYIEPAYCASPVPDDAVCHLAETAWRLPDGIDRRVKVALATVGSIKAWTLETIAGATVGDAEPLQVLDRAHEALQQLFPEVITDRAKHDWGMKPIE